MSAPAATPPAPAWEETRTAHFIFYFGAASYAAKTVDEVTARAEAAYEYGREWFAGDTPLPTMVVYLAGWLPGGQTPAWLDLAGTLVATDQDAICVLMSPESPAIGLERAILELMVRAVTGAVPGRASGLLRALAALISADHPGGFPKDEADRSAHERFRRDKETPQLFAPGDPRSAELADPAELSFLSFLERTRGRAALARMARGILSAELAAAAAAAYGRPLEMLQREWLAELPRRVRGEATGQDVLRRAIPLLRPYKLRVCEVLALMTFDLAFAMVIPLSTKILFDDILGARDFTLLPIWLGAMFTAFAFGAAVNYRRTLVGGWIGESILRDLRRALFGHLQLLSVRFYARSSVGDLMSRLTNDLDHVETALAGSLPALVFSALTLVLGAATLLLLNWMLGLMVLLLGLPVFTLVYSRASERLREASYELQVRFGTMTANLAEALSAQSVIKSFSLERRAIALYEQIIGDLFRGTMRLVRISGVLDSSTEMIVVGIRLAVMGVGAWMILNDRMTVGELVAFIGMIAQVLSPVASISGQYSHLQQASGALERIDEVLGEVPDVTEDPLAVELPPVRRDVQLDHVTFSYAGGQAVLRDVSLTIPTGARVAIVGPSGAGKSTLAGLLLRHYDPDHGRVLFDGRDIREATLASVRRQLAVVPQDTFLFDISIGENIALGREGASDADVVSAAQAAALHEVIERTESGYETLVGERGARLSGGQRQRLAIARALIRDPAVLLLDEATSALDAQTEASILQTLEEAAQGRTMVMITHRLSAAARCDLIFVLEQGRLVEQGTHQELLEQRGLYWRLYNEQQAGALDALGLPVDPSHLVRVPVFAQLSPTDLALVALRITVERYEAGAVVVRQGDVADKLFIVGDGQLEVLVEGRQGPLRVTVLGAYSYFGEIALLSDPPGRRTATVRALTPVELYSLHKEDFLGLLRSQPSLAEAVSGLARRRGEQLRQLLATTSGIARTIASSPATIAAPIIEPGRADEGRPAPPAMLTMREGAQVGRTDVLDGRVVTLGRAIDCEILLPDNGVSRRQCRIRWADDSYVLEDLDSSNGTYVNGSRITTAQLHNGDLIQVGDTVLEFALT